MFARAYQGNMWWVGLGLLSLCMLWQVLWNATHKRNAGLPVEVRSVVGGSLVCLSLLALSIFQVLTHDG